MVDNGKKERLANGIDQLTEENRSYVLGVSQTLVFAQEIMNTPHAIPEKKPPFLEIPNKKDGL